MTYLDLYDITPEQEAETDARALEDATDEWLAAWSDDFNSDEWAASATELLPA
jgi:hypothetical protein